MIDNGYGFATRAIQAGETTDPATRALNTPIYMTSTFAFESAAEKEAAVDAALEWEPDTFFYSRTGNPTTAALEHKLASLEGAEDAAVGAAGMAACATALLSVLDAGDHCVASEDVFIITRFLLDDLLRKKGVEVTRVDARDPEAVRAAIRPNTKALFIESLSNPHMHVADIPALAEVAKGAGLTFIVDNTFLSPHVLRPLEHGADMVVHSATKYLGGHGDALGGVVAGAKPLIDAVRYQLDTLGAAISPFNSWLLLRGVRTLSLRMNAHSSNAMAVAQFLESRDEVASVFYPGLPSHPGHKTARALGMNGFGGMMSIRLHGGEEAMETFASALKLSAIAVSLGDVRTLVYPMPKRNNLIRLSIGCEDTADLLADYEQGLSAVATRLLATEPA
ncbi:MAG TPA: PLP-dependent aspartate aminotransferase family protein [Actinomycetales bacterium]|nr:PLP-dependent aspartate aminotransferase family protein [Actinomycetales bacterium]